MLDSGCEFLSNGLGDWGNVVRVVRGWGKVNSGLGVRGGV